MKSMKAGRLVAAAGIAAAAIAAQIGMASPAAAMYSGCLNYVKSEGYIVGPKVYDACSYQAIKMVTGVWYPNTNCVSRLINIGVEGSDAMAACQRAHG
ncbi:hypothetical protein [Streptomyces hydrogenans]|uniref:hypothetical protein n=1 Tax=Streptomyces hydrogenans TaxID=1873719 RepID=UPI00369D0C5F